MFLIHLLYNSSKYCFITVLGSPWNLWKYGLFPFCYQGSHVLARAQHQLTPKGFLNFTWTLRTLLGSLWSARMQVNKLPLSVHHALDVWGSRLVKINERWPPGFKELSWGRRITVTAKIFVEHFECVCCWVKPFTNIPCSLLSHYMCCHARFIYKKLRFRGFTESSHTVVWQWVQETVSDSLIAEPRLLSCYVDLEMEIQWG